ncbi:MAG TPA: hypothetical protein VME23_18905 [Terracidiphilus sp.]|nr:hypothetical protein [Terracidiphilus sp.]
MSEKLDQLAQELLEKTRNNKLGWIEVESQSDREEFSVALEKEYSFHIVRVVSGEYRTIALQLWRNQFPRLEATARNWPSVGAGEDMQQVVKKFRLYSDLFDAVRESVYGSDETLGEVEQLLRKIG